MQWPYLIVEKKKNTRRWMGKGKQLSAQRRFIKQSNGNVKDLLKYELINVERCDPITLL